jgi:hypothetical protein
MDANIAIHVATIIAMENGRMKYFLHWLDFPFGPEAATEYTPDRSFWSVHEIVIQA